ncbi:VPA1269 family protein [Agarivorans sp. 2_MG-2023]|uniref:VPA1269 family protein n=1 Tax=Agarivorans sp. 2_MG-2023 TaxID=3062647 RepID=UPI0026E2C605|nr:VPA1269 family protein [Agarivorans sp. 2_MG-2023]MDO6717730.1 VPA1269 family protein [Agarivorans sp. 2_MG-2023]
MTKRYQLARQQDPRLPASPQKTFGNDWLGLPAAFGEESIKRYETVEQVMAALAELMQQHPKWSKVPVTKRYQLARQQDPRLPASPQLTFGNDWPGLPAAFGEESVKRYETVEQVMAALAELMQQHPNWSEILATRRYQLACQHDSTLPKDPSCIKGWDGMSQLFKPKVRYPDIKSAFFAVKKILTKDQWNETGYNSIRQLDPLLPEYPPSYYFGEWRTWEHAFGFDNGYYKSLGEAQQAALNVAKAHNIQTNSLGYPLCRKYDPRLPPRLEKLNGWKGYRHFWDPKAKSYYKTVEAARKSALKLGLLSSDKYDKNHTADPRLPPHPKRFYKLASYKAFIEFEHWDAERVHRYNCENKIDTFKKYKTHAREHPYLLVHYDRIKGYDKNKPFLDKQSKLFDWLISAGLELWSELAKAWCKSGTAIAERKRIINAYLLFAKTQLTVSPHQFFDRYHKVPDLDEFVTTLAKSNQNQSAANRVIEFLEYVRKEVLFEPDEETGELIKIVEGDYRHPYKNSVVQNSHYPKLAESDKPLLPYVYIDRAMNWLLSGDISKKSQQSSKSQNPRSSYFKQLKNAQTLFDKDWFDVPHSLIDESDPNCVWRIKDTKDKETNPKYQIWSPVNTLALFTLLRVPLRGIQISYLDSGEGDSDKLIEKEGKLVWTKNDDKLAGTTQAQGVFRRVQSSKDSLLNMWVTTNKTGRIEGGYEAPYFPEDLARWLIRLRDWQTKYNPLEAPTAWSDIAMHTDTDPKLLKRRGKQCFLFRDPRNRAKRKNNPAGSQPTRSRSSFSEPLPKLLYYIQDESLPLTTLIGTGSAMTHYKSIYTPHSLRVSQISSLIFDANISPVVVAKIVGHANIVMTIYYAKLDGDYRIQMLAEAEKRQLAAAQERLADKLLAGEPIPFTELVCSEANPIHSPDWPRASMQFFDFGICPVACGRCNDGGDPLTTAKNVSYTPVQPGFLGNKNCFQCRFFITGPVFIAGLQTKFQEIGAGLIKHNELLEDLQCQIDTLDDQIYDRGKVGGSVTMLERKIKSLTDNHSKMESLRVLYRADQVMLLRLTEDSMDLLNKGATQQHEDTDKLSLILNRPKGQKMAVEIDEVSELRILGEVCENADIFISGNDGDALIRRNQLFDKLLDDNGIPPTFFKLSKTAQRQLGNQVQSLLLSRLNGWNNLDGWTNLDKAISGELHLSDFVTKHQPTNITQEIIALLDKRKQKSLKDKISTLEVQK